MLHTVNFIYRAKRLAGGKTKWESITPNVESINYTAIRY